MRFGWLPSELVLVEDNRLVRTSLDTNNKITVLSDSSIGDVDGCPDGRTILLSLTGRDALENTNVWRINSDGSNLRQLSKGRQDWTVECSPDSKWAYWTNNTTNRAERVSVDGGSPETVPGSVVPHAIIGGHDLDFSPDGKSLAFLVVTAEGTHGAKITLVSLDAGAGPQVRYLNPNLAISSHGLRFTPDGKGVVYPVRQNGVDNLWLQPLDGSLGRQITSFKTGEIQSFRRSPDGKSFGVLTVHRESDVVLLRDTGGSSQ